jgi:hypothetical protein
MRSIVRTNVQPAGRFVKVAAAAGFQFAMTNLPVLQQGEQYHQKWRTVDFSAEVPGWRRF